MTMNNNSTNPISYKTIEEIRLRKAMLQKYLQKDDNLIRNQWHSLFSRPVALSADAKPSRRINSLMTTGAGVLDAFILGWKLYRKFKK